MTYALAAADGRAFPGGKSVRMPQSSDLPRPSSSSGMSSSESVDGAVIEKICVVCGENVAGRPRLKDREGRYFCIACGEADSERKHSVGTPCTDCKKKFPDNQLQLHNEQPVCEACLTKRHQEERDAARRLRAQHEEEEERRARKKQIIIGIAVVVVAIALYFVMF
jgi:hypothetical protein